MPRGIRKRRPANSPTVRPKDFEDEGLLSIPSVIRACERGEIKCVKIGKIYNIPRSELDRVAGRVPAPPPPSKERSWTKTKREKKPEARP